MPHSTATLSTPIRQPVTSPMGPATSRPSRPPTLVPATNIPAARAAWSRWISSDR